MRRKFYLVVLILLVAARITAQNNIALNQLGFYPNGPKIAVVTGHTNAVNFYVINVANNDTAFKGSLSEERQSANSSTVTRIANFSAVHKKGSYTVSVDGNNSYTFQISNNANHASAVASLKGYYYIRSSISLEEKYAGKWARPAGHPDTVVLVHASAADAKRPEGTKIQSPGGWYDAGDYNKYIVNSSITTSTLLAAYEDFDHYFDTLTTNIPESGDKMPDVLNEALYNIRWMLTMQDPNDGGVYHKCTNAAFDGMVMPGVTKLPRYVVQKSTAATLDFAAVTAQAARIFSKFSKQMQGLSDSCLKASVYAWKWAEKNPDSIYSQEAINKRTEPKITTGAYGDKNLSDEWFWSACELYTTTKNEQYYPVVEAHLNDTMQLPSWANVYMLGDYTLVRFEKALSKHNEAIEKIKTRVVNYANNYINNYKQTAFETVMGQSKRDFIWGSNAVAANQAIVLINAYFITKDKKYIHGALSNLDYIVGRNATGYCFITGVGSKSTMHPHHRPSVADNIAEPVPGLLAGGPNPGRQDNCHYDFTEPETAYTDVDCSFASNEIAINWNAPLVYLANAIEALQNKL